jgi:hypothetical protein
MENDDQSDGQSAQALYFGPKPTFPIDRHPKSPNSFSGINQKPARHLHKGETSTVQIADQGPMVATLWLLTHILKQQCERLDQMLDRD